jgi:hypothetical protein
MRVVNGGKISPAVGINSTYVQYIKVDALKFIVNIYIVKNLTIC